MQGGIGTYRNRIVTFEISHSRILCANFGNRCTDDFLTV